MPGGPLIKVLQPLVNARFSNQGSDKRVVAYNRRIALIVLHVKCMTYRLAVCLASCRRNLKPKFGETQGHSGVNSEVANCTILDSQAEEMYIICAL